MFEPVNVMLDLETAGTKPGAPILSIGATSFFPGDAFRQHIRTQFYEKILYHESLVLGFTSEIETLAWWDKQDKSVREEAFSGLSSPAHVLQCFTAYLRDLGGNILLWGNGSDFDNVLLAAYYHRLRMTLPWDFRGNRCYRTLKGMPRVVIPAKPAPVGHAHNSLDDAINQANHAELILNNLSGRR